MPMSQEQADTMLAEFIAQRGITKVKRSVRGPRSLAVKPELLEKAEFEPQNDHIGFDSRGCGSYTGASVRVAIAMHAPTSVIARCMVREYFDGLAGLAPIVVSTISL
jgi:hypothetical protein